MEFFFRSMKPLANFTPTVANSRFEISSRANTGLKFKCRPLTSSQKISISTLHVHLIFELFDAYQNNHPINNACQSTRCFLWIRASSSLRSCDIFFQKQSYRLPGQLREITYLSDRVVKNFQFYDTDKNFFHGFTLKTRSREEYT